MDYQVIKELLDRYWEGETTVEEERELKAFFRQGDVPAEWQPFQAYFQEINAPSPLRLDEAAFEKRLKERLKVDNPAPKRLRLSFVAWRAAAAIALLVAFTAGYRYLTTPAEPTQMAWEQHECKNPEDCLEELQRVLLLVSNKMNKGMGEASKGLSKARTATSIIK